MGALTEEEKERIIERIEFEQGLRKTLSEKDQSSDESLIGNLWEKAGSGLGLLLIGAVVTGILVPIFQNRQKTLEWERQIRYENVKYNLDMRRECLKEFMLVGTYLSQSIELVGPYKNEQRIPDSDFQQIRTKILELQDNRFKQNAKVVAMLVYFSDYEALSRLFDQYTGATTDYLNNIVTRFVFLRHSLPTKPGKSVQGDLKEVMELKYRLDDTTDLTQKFGQVLNYMLQDIRAKEEEYAKAKF
jgi:hypothetical protein